MSSRTPGAPPDLPGFRFLELLGTGGFADVFQYEQLGLGRKVAVKVLLSDIDADVQASFEVEASVMAKLSNHPSIVSIYQAGVTADGRPFLVMEYCPPPHLALRIRARPLTVTKALEVAIQLSGAVETAHRLGILHRDIKPANILFTEFGRAALTDFGISVTTAGAQSGQGIGMSIPWAPPEQLTVGAPMGPSGDVYSLAATLYTAMVGRAPFTVPGGTNDAIAMAPRVRSMPVPPTRRPDVPESLERALRTAMAKMPNERYDSALAFARALQGIQAELHHPVTTIDVLDEQVVDVGAPEDGGGTRLSGFVSIDPEPPPAPPVTFTPPPPLNPTPFPASAVPTAVASPYAPVDPTAERSPQPDGASRAFSHDDGDTALRWSAGAAAAPPSDVGPPPTPMPPERERWRPTPAGVAAAVAVVAAILAVVWLGRGSPDATSGDSTTPRKNQPQEPFDTTGSTPAPPSEVTVRPAGSGQIRVTWTVPYRKAGDRYVVAPYDRTDKADPDAHPVQHSSIIVSARTTMLTTDEKCAAVWTWRGDDNYSDFNWGCVP